MPTTDASKDHARLNARIEHGLNAGIENGSARIEDRIEDRHGGATAAGVLDTRTKNCAAILHSGLSAD